MPKICASKLTIKKMSSNDVYTNQKLLTQLYALSNNLKHDKCGSSYTRTMISSRKNFICWVAFNKSIPVAWVYIVDDYTKQSAKTVSNLWDIGTYVKPTYRGNGIAKVLVKRVIRFVNSKNLGNVQYSPYDIKGKSLYEKYLPQHKRKLFNEFGLV